MLSRQPHHGADLTRWGHILANIVNVAKPANSAPVWLLERGSEMLRDVQDRFHNLLEKRKDEGAKIEITCFYETLPLFGLLVVPQESTIISGELRYPIRANHVVCEMTLHMDGGRNASHTLKRLILSLQILTCVLNVQWTI